MSSARYFHVPRRFRRLWARLFRRAPRPVPIEMCEVCGQLLADEDVFELRSNSTDDAHLEISSGGTYMSAIYCAEHFPSGLTPHLRSRRGQS
jgi:hypothetical protein